MRTASSRAAIAACAVVLVLIQSPALARLEVDDAQRSCAGVTLSRGDRFQSIIKQSPTGQRFCWSPGKFFIRRALVPKAGQQFVAIQPGKTILTGRNDTRIAFDGLDSSNVVLDGLVIMRFSTPVEAGLAAVRAGDGWTIKNAVIKRNGSAGIFHGSNVVIRNNSIHHNGQYGIASFQSRDALVAGNEVSRNNTLHRTQSAEGGAKWTGTRGLVVRNNNFHHNKGNGIWVDGDNIDVVIEGNRSAFNDGKGIHYEVSCRGAIRNNASRGNGESGIEVVASRNVEITGNTVSGNEYGIRLWDQERGGGTNCEWRLREIVVSGNTVTMRRGYTGVESCCGVVGEFVFTSGTVRFNDNVYYLDLDAENFHWLDDAKTVQEWMAVGQDVSSQFNPLP